MGLNYAAEKLGSAIMCALRSTESIQERLASCCEIFAVASNRQHLTPDLQKRFDAVLAACSIENRRNMNDETAGKWLYEMLAIYTEVVKLLSVHPKASEAAVAGRKP